jgi:hypothetical protein
MYQVVYACGCTEEGPGMSAALRCPMHDSPASRIFKANPHALRLVHGPDCKEQEKALFTPAIEGMKTWKGRAA